MAGKHIVEISRACGVGSAKSPQSLLRVAVVGVGYFGQFHVRHFAAHPSVELVAVVDTDAEKASALANQYKCRAITDYRDLIGLVDAVAIAVPTVAHFEVASHLLNAGLHVLIEKPITLDPDLANALAAKSEAKGVVLQVGHIERYSAAFRVLSSTVGRPRYIESYRIAPWRERGVDVDVIFDLMIHDIDLILGLVRSPVTDVEAVGAPLFSGKIDIANARITFASGCVATVTASRVSHKTERSLRIFEESTYLVCDFATRKIFKHTIDGQDLANAGVIAATAIEVPEEDSLGNEIAAFVACIRQRRKPEVDGRVGAEAVRVASRMQDSIQRHMAMFSGKPAPTLDALKKISQG